MIMNFGKLIFLLRKLKTLIIIILSFPLYIIYIPIIITIYTISSLVIFRFGPLQSSRIGPFITCTEIYISKKIILEKKNKKKFIDIFYFSQISNSHLKKMCKEKLNILPRFLIMPLYNLNNFFGLILNFPKKHSIPEETERDVNDVLFKFKNHLTFTRSDESLGIKFLKKMGLKDSQKFVCILARDNEYLDKHSPFKDWSYHETRNDNINNFSKAINLLNEKGYYVFRMGKFVKQKLNIKNPMFLDYACSDYRSDFLDIFLGANCNFLLSSSCGYQAIPMIFKKPLACISFPFSQIYTWHSNCINITKHIYQGDKKINLKEIITSKIIEYFDPKHFHSENLKVINNSSDEIKDLTEEMINFLENNLAVSAEDMKLQNDFWEIYKSSKFGKYNNKIKLHGKFRARIAQKFLKRNFFP